MASSAIKAKVQSIIDDNVIAVFSKSYCRHSNQTKATLAEAGVKPFIVELDQIKDGREMQNALQEMTGQSTVPNIFIGQKHIGGNSDLQAIKSKGDLSKVLTASGALKL